MSSHHEALASAIAELDLARAYATGALDRIEQALRTVRALQRAPVQDEPDAVDALPYTVCLDPGHGGPDDPGTTEGGIVEAEVTLDLARRVADALAGVKGLGVGYTRSTSGSVALRDRPGIVLQHDADCLVSLHVNALDLSPHRDTARGAIVYHYPGSTEGERLARCIGKIARDPTFGWGSRKGLRGPGGVDWDGVKARSDLYVLRETHCPAVLVEVGFATHPVDARRLQDPEWLEMAAQGIAGGIVQWLRGLD